MECKTPEQFEGLCHCGCGGVTPIARQTRSGRGWVKGQPKRFIQFHQNKTTEHVNRLRNRNLGKRLSLKHRMAVSRAHTGREPIFSPYLPDGVIIRFSKGRWVSTDQRDGKLRPHAKIVWEHFNGLVPEGFRVHHKNGDPSSIESDRPDNLMLLTEEWNFEFMPRLAKGFGIPEADVTKTYLQVEHLLYSQRFPEVCRLLLEGEKLCRRVA